MHQCPRHVLRCLLSALKALLCRLDQSNTCLGHPIRMQLKSDFCCDRRGQWGHASATAALQRLGEASITQGWLQGLRGRSEPATWCIWNPPTHIPSTYSMTCARRDTNGKQGEHGSLGDLILTRGDIRYAPVLPHTPSLLLLLSHWMLSQASWQSSSTASPNSPSTRLCSYSNWTLSGPLIALCRAWRTTFLKQRFCRCDAPFSRLFLSPIQYQSFRGGFIMTTCSWLPWG